jgi:hypothetical protein
MQGVPCEYVEARLGKAADKPRDFSRAIANFERYYFSTNPQYDEMDVERRFRVPRAVFDKCYSGVIGVRHFLQMTDATGKS